MERKIMATIFWDDNKDDLLGQRLIIAAKYFETLIKLIQAIQNRKSQKHYVNVWTLLFSALLVYHKKNLAVIKQIQYYVANQVVIGANFATSRYHYL